VKRNTVAVLLVLLFFPLVASCEEPRNSPPTSKDILSNLEFRLSELQGKVDALEAKLKEQKREFDDAVYLLTDLRNRYGKDLPAKNGYKTCDGQQDGPPPPTRAGHPIYDGEDNGHRPATFTSLDPILPEHP